MIEKMDAAKTYIVAVTVVIISAIIGITVYNVNDRILMAKNIDSAIAKGMDPLGVRCSYSSTTDTICMIHSATGSKK